MTDHKGAKTMTETTYTPRFYKPADGDRYEIVTAERIMTLSLADIAELNQWQRAWLSRVWRGNLPSDICDIERGKQELAGQHLDRIGYRPAGAQQPLPKAKKGRGSY
jgi:hypothetical protein